MYMNVLKKELEYKGEKVEFQLRFPVMAQLEFKKKYNEEGMSAVMSTADDLEKQLFFLEKSLSFKDNQNPVTDGKEFYEILVNNGYGGNEDFASLIFEIASVSGILKEEQSKKLSDVFNKTYDAIFDSFENEIETKLHSEPIVYEPNEGEVKAETSFRKE